MDKTGENPYIGPRTFTREERSRFFGRDREARELLTLTVSEQLVIFYAQSGAGKSSLINTCLIPDLEKKGFKVLPVARVGGDAPVGLSVSNIFVYNLTRVLTHSKVPSETLAEMDLATYFSQQKKDSLSGSLSGTADSASERQILILDQFEELFSTHHDRWQDRGTFFTQLADAMDENPNLWIMLVMREDYIAALDPYAHLLPDQARIRYYMQRLGFDAAVKAIRGPVEKLRPFEKGVAEQLARDLGSIKVQGPNEKLESRPGQYVEPVQLQVVCFNLWQKLGPGDSITSSDLLNVGDVNASLASYYDDVVRSVTEKSGFRERKIRQWVGEKLIAPGGIRNMVLQETGETSANLANRVIQGLSGIVRAEARGASIFYELTHDRLVEPIIASNRKWFNENLSPLQKQAALWIDQKRNSSWLLSDDALVKVEEWAKAHPDELTDIERQFLEECRKLQIQIDQKRASEQQQLEMARKLATEKARSARRAMFGNVIAGILLFISCVLLGVAAFATYTSVKNAREARTAEQEARSSQLSTIALDRSGSQLDLAILLGLQANSISNTFETRKALLTILQKAGQYNGTLPVSGQNVQAIQFNPNDKNFAMLDDTGVTLWDFEGHQLGGPFLGNPSPVFATAFSPDGKILASSGKDGSIILWDTQSWTRLSKPLTDHTDWVNNLVFTKDGKTLVSSGDDGKIIFWNVEDPKIPRVIHTIEKDTGGINYAALSPVESIMAGADCCNNIFWWDITDLNNPVEIHPDSSQSDDTIINIAFRPDGKFLASGNLSGTVSLWDVSNPSISTKVGEIEDFSSIYCVAISPDGKILATGDENGGIALWDISEPAKSHKVVDLPREHSGAVNSINFSPDGKLLASAGEDGKILLWDTTTWQVLDTNVSDSVLSPVNSVTFSPDGNMLVTGAGNGSIILWDISNREKASRLEKKLQGNESKIEQMEFSSDGALLTLFSSSPNLNLPNDEFIEIIDANKGSIIDTGHVLSKAADGKFIMYHAYDENSTELQVKILDQNSGILPGEAIPGNILFITPDRRIVVYQTTNEDNISFINLWDQNAQKTIGSPIEGSFVSLSNDGRTLVYKLSTGVTYPQTVFWDVDEATVIDTIITSSEYYYNAITSEDGTIFAYTGYDGNTGKSEIHVYNLPLAEEKVIEGDEPLYLSANDRILLFSGTDENNNSFIGSLDLKSETSSGLHVNGFLGNSIESKKNFIFEVFDPGTGKNNIHVLDNFSGMENAVFQGTYLNLARDGERLIYEDNDNVNIFDVSANQKVSNSINGKFLGVSQNGELLATQGNTSDILLWDLTRTWPLGEPVSPGIDFVSQAVLAPNGNTLAWIDKGGVFLQDTSTGMVSDLPINDHFGNDFSGDSPVFSPDGKLMAIGNFNTHTTTLWDLTAQTQIGGVYSGSSSWFSPDGGTLIISDYDADTTTLWDIHSQTQIGKELPGAYSDLSPDGKILVIGSSINETSSLWDWSTQTQIDLGFPGNSPVFSPDGKILAVGNHNTHTATLWDWATHTQIGNVLPGSSPRFSPDGKILIVGNYDSQTTTVWDLNSLTQIGNEFPGTYSVFSPDGRIIAFADYKMEITKLWDINRQTQVGSDFSGDSPAFSPDGKTLAMGNYSTYTTTLWDWTNHTQIGDDYPGDSPRFSRDGKTLAIGNYDTYISTLWDWVTHTQIGGEFTGANTLFSPDGKTIAFVDFNTYKTTVWDMDIKKSLLLPIKGHPISPDHLTFASDGQYLASQAPDGIAIRDLSANTSTPLDSGEYSGQFTGVMSFYSENKRFIALEKDGTLVTWDVSTGKPTIPEEQPLRGLSLNHTTFSPDGNYLVYEKDNEINIWDVVNGKPYNGSDELPVIRDEAGNIAFNPDGTVLGFIDGKDVLLYKFPELTGMGRFTAGTKNILDVGIVMDNESVRYLITLDESGDTQIWDWATRTKIGDPMPGNIHFVGSGTKTQLVYYIDSAGKLIHFKWELGHAIWQQRLCPFARRNFTQDEWKFYFPDEEYPTKQELLTCPDYPPGQ